MNFDFIFEETKPKVPVFTQNQQEMYTQIFNNFKDFRNLVTPNKMEQFFQQSSLKKEIANLILKIVVPDKVRPFNFTEFKSVLKLVACAQNGISIKESILYERKQIGPVHLSINVFDISKEEIVEYETQSFFCKSSNDIAVLTKSNLNVVEQIAQLLQKNDKNFNIEQIVVILHLIKKNQNLILPKKLPENLKTYINKFSQPNPIKFLGSSSSNSNTLQQTLNNPFFMSINNNNTNTTNMIQDDKKNFNEVFAQKRSKLDQIKIQELQKDKKLLQLEIIRINNQHSVFTSILKQQNNKLKQFSKTTLQLAQNLVKQRQNTLNEFKNLIKEQKTMTQDLKKQHRNLLQQINSGNNSVVEQFKNILTTIKESQHEITTLSIDKVKQLNQINKKANETIKELAKTIEQSKYKISEEFATIKTNIVQPHKQDKEQLHIEIAVSEQPEKNWQAFGFQQKQQPTVDLQQSHSPEKIDSFANNPFQNKQFKEDWFSL